MTLEKEKLCWLICVEDYMYRVLSTTFSKNLLSQLYSMICGIFGGYQSAFVAVHLRRQGIGVVVYQLDSWDLWQHQSLINTKYNTSINNQKCGRCQIDRST